MNFYIGFAQLFLLVTYMNYSAICCYRLLRNRPAKETAQDSIYICQAYISQSQK